MSNSPEPQICKVPCNECPFNRNKVVPGALGGSPVTVYVGQIMGPFFLPCHSHTDFDDPNWKTDRGKPQCAGAAIFRANLGVDEQMPPFLLRLAKGHPDVFETLEEFVAYHTESDETTAAMFLILYPPEMLREFALAEAMQKGARFHGTVRRHDGGGDPAAH